MAGAGLATVISGASGRQPSVRGGGSIVRDVPMSECDCEPPDLPGACIGDYAGGRCVRIDGPPVKTKSGQLSTLSMLGECINCEGCMDDPPPPLACTSAASVTFNQSLTASVDAGISVGDDTVKASFSRAVGAGVAAGATVTQTCSTIAPPCKVVEIEARSASRSARSMRFNTAGSRPGPGSASGGEPVSSRGRA